MGWNVFDYVRIMKFLGAGSVWGEQIYTTSGGNDRWGVGGEGEVGRDQSVIVRLSYEQLNTGHKAGVSLSIGDKHPARTS